MKYPKLNFSQALIAAYFLLLSSFAFAQTRAEAVNTLKQAFSTRFVKTDIVRVNEYGGHTFDYEITETYLLIRNKYTVGEDDDSKNHYWTYIPFETIQSVFAKEKSTEFKKTTSLTFTSSPYNYFKTGNGKVHLTGAISDSRQANFPFKLEKNDPIVGTIIKAINVIATEIRKEQKVAKDLLDAANHKDGIDDLFLNDNRLKQIAYYKLPSYEVFTSDSVKVNLATYLEKNRIYADKPTLLITFSNVWCGPCLKKIDSLLNSGAALKYNIVLVNRDMESSSLSFSGLRKKIAARIPDYNKNTILLFDRSNQLQDLDNGAAPFFTWLDKKLNIIGTYAGYGIKTAKMISVLDEIDADKAAFNFIRYYDAQGIPCKIDKAAKKVEIGIIADTEIYQLSVYDINNKVPNVKARYTKDGMGRFIRKE
ncbi:MAG: hypothetical protein M3R17_10690 [Bacteroidota bacterium]|nr:hypothetical protein [Bacteroidota bacterium]